jgi:hypothetical protein
MSAQSLFKEMPNTLESVDDNQISNITSQEIFNPLSSNPTGFAGFGMLNSNPIQASTSIASNSKQMEMNNIDATKIPIAFSATGPNQYPTKYDKSQYGEVYTIISQILAEGKRDQCKDLEYSYSENEARFHCRLFNPETDYSFQIGFFMVLSQPKLYIQILRVKERDDLAGLDRPSIIDIIEEQFIDPSFTQQKRKNTTTIFRRSIISTRTLQEGSNVMMMMMTQEQFKGLLNHALKCCLETPSLEMKLYGIKTLRQFLTQSYYSSFIQNNVEVQEKMIEAVYLLGGEHGWEVNEQAVMTLSTLMNNEITNEFNRLIQGDKNRSAIITNLQRIADKQVVDISREKHAVDKAKALIPCITDIIVC